MRRILPRFTLFRTIVPRVTRPILPLTSSRLSTTPETRTFTGGLLRISPFRAMHTTTPARLSHPDASEQQQQQQQSPGSLSGRLKMLMRAYGWYAVGVYVVIGFVDFAVAFAGVRLLGADYVSSVAASAKAWLLGLLHSRPPEPGREEIEDVSRSAVPGGQEGLYAMLVLAWTVHKTLFMPVRIGATAAFTPRFVNWLRARGWAGGEGTRRAVQEMKTRLRDRD